MAEDNRQNFVEMSLGDHLEELRIRLILAIIGLAVGLTVCLFFSKFFLMLLTKPYFDVQVQTGLPATLQAITLSEKFMVYMKTALLFGLIFSSPWVFYQLWKFVSAGLYANEKKFIHIVSPICALLFSSGALFFLLIISPLMIRFFIAFDPGIKSVETQVTISSYISFMLLMMLVFGLCFQMPIAIVAANKIGIVSVKNLKNTRKYVLIGIFIVAAVITPSADMISQVALAVPMYILYEIGILFCR
ncbi:MAG: twin arginine-targeting protein translocase TatC [Planctomycetes bacterium GWF2_41_51]|nr:MAG: twin arginine-targeting protein translocase TatC [Planctomycetes bacterium GWF2_41_51]HBG26321.1 twin-arginine translocase subunit TatC [Phycisphaerales bacterium]